MVRVRVRVGGVVFRQRPQAEEAREGSVALSREIAPRGAESLVSRES